MEGSLESPKKKINLRLSRCPRCQGNLFLIKEEDGWVWWCLQCGYSQQVKLKGKPRRLKCDGACAYSGMVKGL